MIREIRDHGLKLTSFEGFERGVAPSGLTLSEDPSIFSDVGAVLVSVKSADTPEIAGLIAKHAPPDAVIVSLQNGVGNVPVLRQRLPVVVSASDPARVRIRWDLIASPTLMPPKMP